MQSFTMNFDLYNHNLVYWCSDGAEVNLCLLGVHGTVVTGPEGKPAPNAVLTRMGSRQNASLSPTGHYNLILPEGEHRLYATAQGKLI